MHNYLFYPDYLTDEDLESVEEQSLIREYDEYLHRYEFEDSYPEASNGEDI